MVISWATMSSPTTWYLLSFSFAIRDHTVTVSLTEGRVIQTVDNHRGLRREGQTVRLNLGKDRGPISLTTVQVPNLTLTYTKRITVRQHLSPYVQLKKSWQTHSYNYETK
jgi:hypothetical protein